MSDQSSTTKLSSPKFSSGDKVRLGLDNLTHTVTAVLRGAYVAKGVQGNAYQLDNKAATYNEADLVMISESKNK